MDYRCPHCGGVAKPINGAEDTIKCEGEVHCQFMGSEDDFEWVGNEANSQCSDGLASKEFYYFPNVVCDCGQAMVHGFNFVHCININCENNRVTFGLPKIKLEAR